MKLEFHKVASNLPVWAGTPLIIFQVPLDLQLSFFLKLFYAKKKFKDILTGSFSSIIYWLKQRKSQMNPNLCSPKEPKVQVCSWSLSQFLVFPGLKTWAWNPTRNSVLLKFPTFQFLGYSYSQSMVKRTMQTVILLVFLCSKERWEIKKHVRYLIFEFLVFL